MVEVMAIHEPDLIHVNTIVYTLTNADPDETAVRIEIATVDGGTIFSQCVVRHRGTEVVDVRLPDGHGALASVAGIPWQAAAEWEGYLCILARLAFARGWR
jgi:hypothetical protein